MKKLVVLAAAAALMLSTAAAAPAPAISTSGESSAAATTQVLVYRCWTYNTLQQTWWGQHRNLNAARRLAMTACVNNTPYGQVCYHNTNPCEELYL